MEFTDITYPIDQQLVDKGYKRLGWRNFWKDNKDPIASECSSLAHDTNEMSHSRRGSDHTIWCDICQYFYKLDTSD